MTGIIILLLIESLLALNTPRLQLVMLLFQLVTWPSRRSTKRLLTYEQTWFSLFATNPSAFESLPTILGFCFKFTRPSPSQNVQTNKQTHARTHACWPMLTDEECCWPSYVFGGWYYVFNGYYAAGGWMAGRVGLEWCWSRVITRVTSCGCCSQTRGGRGGSRGHGRRRTEMNMRAPDTRGVDVVQSYGNGVWNNSPRQTWHSDHSQITGSFFLVGDGRGAQ